MIQPNKIYCPHCNSLSLETDCDKIGDKIYICFNCGNMIGYVMKGRKNINEIE